MRTESKQNKERLTIKGETTVKRTRINKKKASLFGFFCTDTRRSADRMNESSEGCFFKETTINGKLRPDVSIGTTTTNKEIFLIKTEKVQTLGLIYDTLNKRTEKGEQKHKKRREDSVSGSHPSYIHSSKFTRCSCRKSVQEKDEETSKSAFNK